MLGHLPRTAADRSREARRKRNGGLPDLFTAQDCENGPGNPGYGSVRGQAVPVSGDQNALAFVSFSIKAHIYSLRVRISIWPQMNKAILIVSSKSIQPKRSVPPTSHQRIGTSKT